MDFLKPVDIYCERTDFTFFSEPLNLISNLAFIVAGWLILKNVGNSAQKKDARILGVLCLVVGVGSALFHSYATVWSQIADVLPIGVLVLFYLYSFSLKILGLSYKGVGALFVLLFGSSYLFVDIIDKEAMNGSQSYLGVLFCMLILGRLDKMLNNSKVVAKAALVFAVSLAFRSADMDICNSFSLGTHYLWHMLNGYMLYLLGSRYWKNKASYDALFFK